MGSPKRPYRDPRTRDWVLVRGQRKADETHSTDVMTHMSLVRGSSVAFPQYGSTFHEITKMTPDVTKRAELATEQCLKVLTDDGRISGLTAQASLTANVNALELNANYYDSLARENEKRLRITVGTTRTE